MSSVYSVTQVNTYIKNMFSQDFLLTKIKIKGEISNCKYHNSGHIYFTMKDSGGVIQAVMFASNRVNLNFELTDGMQVIAGGRIGVYEKSGVYQLYADSIEEAGTGDLYRKFIILKEKLEKTGIFDPVNKKRLPFYCSRLGIATAKEGAALRDIVNISLRRNPYIEIVICPCIVQGAAAKESIINALKTLDIYGVDVIIAGRGGGSIEDLWAFNEEEVAKALYNCKTPVISAVGHETDYTIADFAADLRASTPSAAAELAVIDINSFIDRLEVKKDLMKAALLKRFENISYELAHFKTELEHLSPGAKLALQKRICISIETRLREAARHVFESRRHEAQLMNERLKALSPLDKLELGYAFVTDKKFKRINSVKKLKKDDIITLRFRDGSADAKIISGDDISSL